VVAIPVDSHHVAEESLHQSSVICSTKTTESKNTEGGEKIMKKIAAILLVSLLGFLGCSDSNDGTSTFAGEAVPVAPFGNIYTGTPSYEWTPVHGATRYQLLVERPGGSDTPVETVIEEWFTADEAGCLSGDALCSVTPEVPVDGNRWKVLACAGEECGLWSDELEFGIPSAGPKQQRFTDNGDGTVTDNNTGLMWTQNAAPPNGRRMDWYEAVEYCEGLTHANKTDWMIPTLSYQHSLVIPHCIMPDCPPALLPGHPFTNVPPDTGYPNYFWTGTISSFYNEELQIWCMDLRTGNPHHRGPFEHWQSYVWCVRHPEPPF